MSERWRMDSSLPTHPPSSGFQLGQERPYLLAEAQVLVGLLQGRGRLSCVGLCGCLVAFHPA